jgi:hypothetical protein
MFKHASTTGYTTAMKRRGGASLLKLGSVVQLYDSVLRGSHYVRQLSHSGGLLSPPPRPWPEKHVCPVPFVGGFLSCDPAYR